MSREHRKSWEWLESQEFDSTVAYLISAGRGRGNGSSFFNLRPGVPGFQRPCLLRSPELLAEVTTVVE